MANALRVGDHLLERLGAPAGPARARSCRLSDAGERRRRVVIVGGGFGGLGRRARAPAGRRRRDARRPDEPPPLPAAALPGGGGRRVGGRVRGDDPCGAETRPQHDRADGRGGGRRRRAGARSFSTAASALGYDSLIVACGAETSYFGNDEWADVSCGLKTLRRRRRPAQPHLRRVRGGRADARPGGPRGVADLRGHRRRAYRSGGRGRACDHGQHSRRGSFARIGPHDGAGDPARRRRARARSFQRVALGQGRHGAGRARRDRARGRQGHGDRLARGDDRGRTARRERIPSRTVIWAAGVRPSG